MQRLVLGEPLSLNLTHYMCSAVQNLLPSRLRIVGLSKRHNQKPQATAEKHFCLSQINHTYTQQIAGPFHSNFIISTKKQRMKLKQSLRKIIIVLLQKKKNHIQQAEEHSQTQ